MLIFTFHSSYKDASWKVLVDERIDTNLLNWLVITSCITSSHIYYFGMGFLQSVSHLLGWFQQINVKIKQLKNIGKHKVITLQLLWNRNLCHNHWQSGAYLLWNIFRLATICTGRNSCMSFNFYNFNTFKLYYSDYCSRWYCWGLLLIDVSYLLVSRFLRFALLSNYIVDRFSIQVFTLFLDIILRFLYIIFLVQLVV